MPRMLRNLVMAAACGVVLILATGISAGATVTPTTGQPGAPTNTCGSANPVTPGNAANVAGSPFNSSGQAGVVYAGNPSTASLAHSNSAAAVSQYDTACVRLSH
jgi:hypothetical protein